MVLDKINGFKSYALGAVTIAIGALELLGVDVVPSVDPASAFAFILAGFAIITGKSALAKLEPPVE